MIYANLGEYAEDRGAPRHGNNPLSFPRKGAFFKATEKVLPWDAPGTHETEERAILPSAYVEALFRRVKVAHPDKLKPVVFLVKCLGWDEFVGPGLDKLMDEGLLTKQDEGGEDIPVVFDDVNELYAAAGSIVDGLQDDPSFEVKPSSFEWLEGFTDRAVDAGLKWFFGLDLEMLTAPTGTLELYIDLNFIIGPRSMENIRIEVGGTCHTMVATPGGGQIGQAIRTFFSLDPPPTPSTTFGELCERVWN